jgi:hypothetical protein
MLDGSDITFAQALERRIMRELNGDRDYTGLYQSIRASPNWDMFQRTNGMITAYENVLNEMRKIARQLNSDPQERGEAVMRPIN